MLEILLVHDREQFLPNGSANAAATFGRIVRAGEKGANFPRRAGGCGGDVARAVIRRISPIPSRRPGGFAAQKKTESGRDSRLTLHE